MTINAASGAGGQNADTVRFGLAQQSRNIIGLANDAVIPFWGGRMLSITAVGYLNWARQTA